MIEVKKVSCRQDTHGEWFVTIKLHPNDVDDGLVKSQPGTVFNIEYWVDGGDGEPQQTVNLPPDGLVGSNPTPPTKSLGERIRTRAVLLCKDERFKGWVNAWGVEGLSDDYTRKYVLNKCQIKSRSELSTNEEAQKRFLELERRYREETGQVAEARG